MLAAWRWAAAQRNTVLLGKAANALLLFCDFRYRFQEGEAAFRQASAIIDLARASYFPVATVNASAQRTGAGSGSRTSSSGSRSFSSGRTETLYDVSASATWVPDLWGKIRRTVESDTALAQVSASDVASARLSLYRYFGSFFCERTSLYTSNP